MAKISHFAFSANTGEGVNTLYDGLLDWDNAYDVLLLKGGAGMGKSEFIQSVGETLHASGEDVEYLWCSGVESQLDGLVCHGLHCAIVDGTAPHEGVQKPTQLVIVEWVCLCKTRVVVLVFTTVSQTRPTTGNQR